jgi:hypothetical protein
MCGLVHMPRDAVGTVHKQSVSLHNSQQWQFVCLPQRAAAVTSCTLTCAVLLPSNHCLNLRPHPKPYYLLCFVQPRLDHPAYTGAQDFA